MPVAQLGGELSLPPAEVFPAHQMPPACHAAESATWIPQSGFSLYPEKLESRIDATAYYRSTEDQRSNGAWRSCPSVGNSSTSCWNFARHWFAFRSSPQRVFLVSSALLYFPRRICARGVEAGVRAQRSLILRVPEPPAPQSP